MHVLALFESSWARHTEHLENRIGFNLYWNPCSRTTNAVPRFTRTELDVWDYSRLICECFAGVPDQCAHSLTLIWHTGVWVLNAVMRSGSEEGSYLRLVDFCITQL